MTEQRLGDLAIMGMCYSERKPVEEVCEEFIQAYPRGTFQASFFFFRQTHCSMNLKVVELAVPYNTNHSMFILL